MGVYILGENPLQPLTNIEEMRLVANGAPQATGAANTAWIKLLESNKDMAAELGAAMTRALRSFAAAYPGQTREQRFTAEEWREAKYEDMARIAELMDLDKS